MAKDQRLWLVFYCAATADSVERRTTLLRVARSDADLAATPPNELVDLCASLGASDRGGTRAAQDSRNLVCGEWSLFAGDEFRNGTAFGELGGRWRRNNLAYFALLGFTLQRTSPDARAFQYMDVLRRARVWHKRPASSVATQFERQFGQKGGGESRSRLISRQSELLRGQGSGRGLQFSETVQVPITVLPQDESSEIRAWALPEALEATPERGASQIEVSLVSPTCSFGTVVSGAKEELGESFAVDPDRVHWKHTNPAAEAPPDTYPIPTEEDLRVAREHDTSHGFGDQTLALRCAGTYLQRAYLQRRPRGAITSAIANLRDAVCAITRCDSAVDGSLESIESTVAAALKAWIDLPPGRRPSTLHAALLILAMVEIALIHRFRFRFGRDLALMLNAWEAVTYLAGDGFPGWVSARCQEVLIGSFAFACDDGSLKAVELSMESKRRRLREILPSASWYVDLRALFDRAADERYEDATYARYRVALNQLQYQMVVNEADRAELSRLVAETKALKYEKPKQLWLFEFFAAASEGERRGILAEALDQRNKLTVFIRAPLEVIWNTHVTIWPTLTWTDVMIALERNESEVKLAKAIYNG